MGYLTLSAAGADYVSAPTSINLDVTNDLDIFCRIKGDLTVGNVTRPLVARRESGSNFSLIYMLLVSSTDNLRLEWEDAGDTAHNEASTSTFIGEGLSGVQIVWLRATLDVDNGAGGYDVKFYYSTDTTDNPASVTWTQMGATVTGGSTTSIMDGRSSVLEVGTHDLGVVRWSTALNLYRALVKDGIAGTVIFDADFTNLAVASGVDGETFIESSANAATVTIHGTGWSYVSAAVSGSVVAGGVLESEIIGGGETIILTLSNDTWVATVGDDNAITQALIDGIDSAQAEAGGWDAVVKANMVFGDVVRTSDTVITITLAAEASYAITADETISVTIPATALTSGTALVGLPTFDITNEAPTLVLLGVPRSPRYGITRMASR